jgi:hypothetical protein
MDGDIFETVKVIFIFFLYPIKRKGGCQMFYGVDLHSDNVKVAILEQGEKTPKIMRCCFNSLYFQKFLDRLQQFKNMNKIIIPVKASEIKTLLFNIPISFYKYLMKPTSFQYR